MTNAGIGYVLLLVAAVAGGLYMTPLTVTKTDWSFEATWCLYTLFGLVLFPWTIGLMTCPGLIDALGSVGSGKLLLTALFGFLWGVGCQLFGIGIKMVGNSLGFALILGLAATLGSIIPLVVLHPHEVGSKAGLLNFIGLSLAVVALVATAVAGIRKERDMKAAKEILIVERSEAANTGLEGPETERGSDNRGSFTMGIVICVLSGVFSACLNLATSFGHGIADAAVANGANQSMSTNAIYCVSVASGGVPNLAYCVYVMTKNGEFPFRHGAGQLLRNVMTTACMGVLWFGSNIAYGVATTTLPGDLGTVVGWPIYIIGMVLFANVSGIVQGEWKGASRYAKAWMGVGLVILCLAIIAVGLAG